MPHWLQYVLAGLALAVIAPVIALGAKRSARKLKGGWMLAGILMGLGEAVDPPSKHIIEASGDQEREAPPPGEPPLPK